MSVATTYSTLPPGFIDEPITNSDGRVIRFGFRRSPENAELLLVWLLEDDGGYREPAEDDESAQDVLHDAASRDTVASHLSPEDQALYFACELDLSEALVDPSDVPYWIQNGQPYTA